MAGELVAVALDPLERDHAAQHADRVLGLMPELAARLWDRGQHAELLDGVRGRDTDEPGRFTRLVGGVVVLEFDRGPVDRRRSESERLLAPLDEEVEGVAWVLLDVVLQVQPRL